MPLPIADGARPSPAEGGADVVPVPVTDAGGPVDAAAGVPFDPQTPVHVGNACTPYAQAATTPFVPAGAPDADALADATTFFPGSWIGVATAPPAWSPNTWFITVQFEPDGYYTGLGFADGTNPPPFYYGTNDFSDPSCRSAARWRLTGLDPAGGVAGEIDVPFWEETSCGLPVWQGELHGIALDAPGDRMQLAFRRSDGYARVTYDLFRACGP
jgi:hypothetical protein